MQSGKRKMKQIRVADWMTETVLAVETFDSISIDRQLMAKHRINQLPVLDNDLLVGIVTDRDWRHAYPTSMMLDRGNAIDPFTHSVNVEVVVSPAVLTARPDT